MVSTNIKGNAAFWNVKSNITPTKSAVTILILKLSPPNDLMISYSLEVAPTTYGAS